MTPFEKYRHALTLTGTEGVLARIAATSSLEDYIIGWECCDRVDVSDGGVSLVYYREWGDDPEDSEDREMVYFRPWDELEQDLMLRELSVGTEASLD